VTRLSDFDEGPAAPTHGSKFDKIIFDSMIPRMIQRGVNTFNDVRLIRDINRSSDSLQENMLVTMALCHSIKPIYIGEKYGLSGNFDHTAFRTKTLNDEVFESSSHRGLLSPGLRTRSQFRREDTKRTSPHYYYRSFNILIRDTGS